MKSVAGKSVSTANECLDRSLTMIGARTRNCYRYGIEMSRCFWTYSKFLLKMAAFSAKQKLLILSAALSPNPSAIMSGHYFSQLAKLRCQHSREHAPFQRIDKI